jgi:hypothetical protein
MTNKMRNKPSARFISVSLPMAERFGKACHVKTDQSWIQKGKLEALNLPSLGIIIEAEKLNEFLYHKNS